MARATTIDPRTIRIRRAISLEAHVGAQAADDRGVHILELAARRQLLLESRINDREIARHAEPLGRRDVVVELDRVLVIETQAQAIAEQRDEIVAELEPRP